MILGTTMGEQDGFPYQHPDSGALGIEKGWRTVVKTCHLDCSCWSLVVVGISCTQPILK